MSLDWRTQSQNLLATPRWSDCRKMPEADVLYSDVKFTKTKGKANVSPSPDTTYSEVKILKTQPYTEPCDSQQTVSSRRSKVTAERVALLVVSVLLIAALIALGLTAFGNMKTKETPQHPKEGPVHSRADASCQGCDAGWEHHGGMCYYFYTMNSSWTESRRLCQNLGGDLVKIDSEDEQKFLEGRLRNIMLEQEDKFWIGLTDRHTEDTWLWLDGSPLNPRLSFWSPNEPDNWKGPSGTNPDGEDCVRMGEKNGAHDLRCWFDKSCETPHRSICEKTAVTGTPV